MGPSSPRSFAAVGAFAAVLAFAGVASAQTISVSPPPKRSTGEEHAQSIEKRFWITHEDCVLDDELQFTVVVSNSSGYNLEVWASQNADCSVYEERQSGSASCWRVYAADAVNGTYDKNIDPIAIRAQDLATMAAGTHAENTGTAADCNPGTRLTQGGMGVKLYFMLVNGEELGGTVATYETGLDLRGPEPPTGVASTVAESKLQVSWELGSGDDWYGYKLYCASAADAAAAGGATGTGGTATTGGVIGTGGTSAAGANAAGANAAGASASTTGGVATGGATANGGAAESTVPSDCDFGVLIPGEIPDSRYECGSGESRLADEGLATGLADSTPYAVGVAGVDLLGNPGPLSTVVCGTPQPVTTFYEAYRNAGGEAGGGFCAFALGRSPASLGGLAVAASLLVLRRRRRSRA